MNRWCNHPMIVLTKSEESLAVQSGQEAISSDLKNHAEYPIFVPGAYLSHQQIHQV